MATGEPLERVAQLEREVEQLRLERAEALAQGAMLKTLLDSISRRNAAEDRAEQAEQWLDLAQEVGAVASYAFDFASQSLTWSASTTALYGFEPGCVPTFERWLGSIHPEDLPAVRQVVDATLNQGAPVDQQFRIILSDGAIRWIQDRGRVLRDAEGRASKLVGINIDVTELIELQLKLSGERQRLQVALEAGQLSSWDWDVPTNQVVWDDNLARFAGLDDFAGTFDAFWALVHDDDKPIVRSALDRALEGPEDYEVDFRMMRPDGSVRWTSTRAKVVRDSAGFPLRLIGIDGDITRQKEFEESLRSSEAFLRSVLEASTDCVKIVELDGTLSFMNENGLCALELDSFSQVAGQQWSTLWPEDSTDQIDWSLAEARAGRRSQFEAFCPTAKGSPRWWEVTVSPAYDPSGAIGRIVSVSRDITTRRAQEEQLRLLNRELHHRVKNNLAIVQAIASSTAQRATSIEAFEDSFGRRIEALGTTHTLLLEGQDSTTIADLLQTELAPYGEAADKVFCSGPPATVTAEQAVALGMIFHELTTNACKYGGLSPRGNGIEVRWRIDPVRDGRELTLDWVETADLDPVSDKGFGTRLIHGLAHSKLRGAAKFDFSPAGLRLALTAVLA